MFGFGIKDHNDNIKNGSHREHSGWYSEDDELDDTREIDTDEVNAREDDDRFDDTREMDACDEDGINEDEIEDEDDHFDDTREMDACDEDGINEDEIEDEDDRFDDTREMDACDEDGINEDEIDDDDDDRFDDTREMDACDEDGINEDEIDDDEDDRFDDTREMDACDEDGIDEDLWGDNADSDDADRYASDQSGEDTCDGRRDGQPYEDEYDSWEDEGTYESDIDDDAEGRNTDKLRKTGRRRNAGRRNAGRRRSHGRAAVFFDDLVYKIKHMSNMDRIVAATGAFVLVVAIVTVSIYANAKSVQKQVNDFQSIGNDMGGVTVIGQSGLIAVSDAENARLAAMTESTEESTEESSSEDAEITVKLKLTSIKSDLKLKFVNKETGKLIAGVPFKATASGASKISLTDDDEDGIIYKKDVTAGKYTVKVSSLPDDIKDKYKFDSDSAECTVSDQIEYKKVDVKDEVKTEKQVNASKEDTQTTGDTPVESQLTDTVEWVESSKVGADGSSADGYVEVNKSDVPDPGNVSNIVFFKADTNGSSSSDSSAASSSTGESSASSSAETPSSSSNEAASSSAAVSSSAVTSSNSSSSSVTTSTAKTGQTLTLSPDSAKIIKGKTVVITPTITGASDTTVTWAASDSKIASISAASTSGGTAVTVTAVGAGTTTITAVLKENTSVTAKCTITVTAVDPTTKLVDKNGNQLYVLVNGKYVAATYADYAKYDKFYRKSDNSNWVYTGWQTIDGATFFYTKDHSFVTGEQVIQGVKYTFGSDGHLQAGSGKLGIDVSKWNGSIDWSAVRNSGVSYAIIRCGYRGKSGGALIQDPRFSANIRAARAAGLSVGIYFFSQATSDVEAVEEASMAVNMASGCGVSLPIYIDVEGSGGRGDAIDVGTRTAVCKAFCATVRNSGYAAGVYSNKSWLTSKINTGSLTGYKIWLAQYAAQPTYTATRYDMWQYSSKGRIAGINGNVDMNLRFN